MRINSKGQVTIPADIREKADMLPGTEVEFHFGDQVVTILKKKGRGAWLVAHLTGKGDVAMTTDEIMKLTRGE